MKSLGNRHVHNDYSIEREKKKKGLNTLIATEHQPNEALYKYKKPE